MADENISAMIVDPNDYIGLIIKTDGQIIAGPEFLKMIVKRPGT